MAKVHVPHLAGQTAENSRFGTIKFDKKGNAEVSNKVAHIINTMAPRGWKVSGLEPDEEVDGKVDDEELDEEDLGLSTSAEDEGDEADESDDGDDSDEDDGIAYDLGDEDVADPEAQTDGASEPVAKKKRKKKGKKKSK